MFKVEDVAELHVKHEEQIQHLYATSITANSIDFSQQSCEMHI